MKEFRERQIPIDNIVIDWLHWKQDSWGSHEVDPERFPDPKGMVDSIPVSYTHLSLCRFGDPRDYSQLGDVFKLYDKEGKDCLLYTSRCV